MSTDKAKPKGEMNHDRNHITRTPAPDRVFQVGEEGGGVPAECRKGRASQDADY